MRKRIMGAVAVALLAVASVALSSPALAAPSADVGAHHVATGIEAEGPVTFWQYEATFPTLSLCASAGINATLFGTALDWDCRARRANAVDLYLLQGDF